MSISRSVSQFVSPRAVSTVLAAHLAVTAIWADSKHMPVHTQAAPVVITISRGLPHSPLTVVANPQQPRQPMPASDGADYLETIAGFATLRNGGANGDPVFRGMFGSRLNLLSDGGAMPGACPSRMDPAASYIRPETYDKLIITKGPQSVVWGTGSAATVRFEREPARFLEPGAWGEISLLGGSAGRFDRNLDAAAGAADGYLRVLASRSSADDYRDGNGDRIPSRWDKWSADLLLGWTPDASTVLELGIGAGDGEARYGGRGMDGSQFRRESLSLRFQREFEAAGQQAALRDIDARLYYNYADHVMDNYSLRQPSGTGMMAGPMASNVDRRTVGGRLAGTWRGGGWQFEAGIDGQHSEHRGRMGMDIGTYDDGPWLTDAVLQSVGVFGEVTRELPGAAKLVAGLRLDQVAARDERAQLGRAMNLRPNPTAGERREATLGSGFIRYERALAGATAYVGLGHSSRFPDYWELYSPDQGPDGSVNAFEAVDPERTAQLDLGMHYQRGAVSAWATAYAGVVEDFMLFRYWHGMMGMVMTEADNIDARIAGMEWGAGYQLTQRWSVDSSVAWAWGENRSDGRPLPQMPPLEARFTLAWQHANWSASALWRVVARQGRVAPDQGNVAGKDFGDSSGFGVFSVNAAWQASESLGLSAAVDNLFDKAYAEHLNLAGNAGFGFPDDPQRLKEPGRTLWVRMDLRF